MEGNQPAICAFVKTSALEKRMLTRSILVQKLGSNAKSVKAYDDLDEKQQKGEEEEKILIKYARIGLGAMVKWTRKIGRTSSSPMEEGEGRQPDGSQSKDQQREAGYSLMLSCSRCGESQETKRMQLRTPQGYRAIHCRSCRKQ